MIEAEVTKKRINGKFKDDSMYLLNGAKDIFQGKLLEHFMDDDNKMDENVEEVLLLTNELLEKDKIIVIMQKNIDKKNEELLISYQNKKVMLML